MSERASFSTLQSKRGRRIAEPEIAGLGVVRLQSLTPSEYVRVEGLQSRAALAFNEGKKGVGIKLLAEGDELLIRLMWVKEDGSPEVPSDATEPFSDTDMGIFAALIRACKEHAGIDGKGVDVAVKNYEATSGSGSS